MTASKAEHEEVWIPVQSLPDRYEVSSHGRVRSLMNQNGRRSSPRILRPSPRGRRGREYLSVNLLGHQHPVHILVCQAFHGNRPPGTEAAHTDGNRFNNCASNIRWATPKENAYDKTLHGTQRRGAACVKSVVLTEEIVTQARIAVKSGERSSAIARRLGIAQRTVSAAVFGSTWSHLAEPPAQRYGTLDFASLETIKSEYCAGTVSADKLAAKYGISRGKVLKIIHGQRTCERIGRGAFNE